MTNQTIERQMLETFDEALPSPVTYCEPIVDNGAVVDFRYVWGNAVSRRFNNKTDEELRSITLLELFPGLRGTDIFNQYVRAYETGEMQRFERPSAGGAGEERWLAVTVVRRYEGILITALDITATKTAQKQIEQQAALLQEVIEAAPAGMVLYEPVMNKTGQVIDFRYAMTNPANAAVTGVSVENMTGHTLKELFPASFEGGFFRRLLSVYETGTPIQSEDHYTGDGLNVWVNQSMVKAGNAVLFVYQDVTALKQQQASLGQRNEQLRQSNQRLEDFTNLAGHDIKEPLRRLKMLIDILGEQHGAKLDPSGQRFVQEIGDLSGKVIDTIDALLDYSALTNLEEPFANVALTSALEQARGGLGDAGRAVEAGPLPVVWGSAYQLDVVLRHLLHNAVKFKKATRPLLVRVTAEEMAFQDVPHQLKRDLNPATADRWHVLTVADNGIGFDPAERHDIFTLFYRAHGGSKYAGQGFGLAIVKMLVSNHGGAVAATGVVDQGATFLVALPVKNS